MELFKNHLTTLIDVYTIHNIESCGVVSSVCNRELNSEVVHIV